MATENIQVNVDSSQLQALIRQLDQAQAELSSVKAEANQAASAMDNLGDEAVKAGNKVEAAGNAGADGMGAMGLAAGAGAAAVAGVAAAAALAATAISKYAEETANQETQLNSLLNQTDDFLKSLGETIMESDGASRAMGVMSRVMTILTNNMDTIGSVISTIVNFGLEALNRAIQVGVVGFTAYRLAVIAAEANLQIVMTAVLNLGDYIARATLAVAGLGLAFTEGLVKAMQLGIDKFGQLITAIAPFASRMGIDLSGVTASLGNMNEGLDTVVAGLQGVQAAAAQTGLDIAARQAERLDRLQTNLADSAAEAWAEIETMGDRMIAVDATFNTANDTLGETVRVTDELATSIAEAAEVVPQSLGILETATRSIFGAVRQGVSSFGEGIAYVRDQAAQLQAHLDEQAAATQSRMAQEEADRATSLEAFKTDIEQRFELLHGYSMAYEEMTNKQIQNTARMTDDQAKAIGFARETIAQAGAASVAALAAAVGEGKSAADALKAVIGQELVNVGTAAIFKGAIKTAGGNPMGLAEAAAGVAAVAAGTAMGGGGGGASPSVAPSTTPGSNQTTYTNVSMGFVGDRRSAAREVADVQRDAMRRGL
jgi:hypothetical protein